MRLALVMRVVLLSAGRRSPGTPQQSADPEPDTDVGAPLDCPSDLAVLQPNGSTYRPAGNDSEAAELLEAAGWINWDATRQGWGTGLVVAVPHAIT